MPILLSIVTTEDIIADEANGQKAVRDRDVKAALKTDRRARKAHDAARKGRKLLKALEEEDN